MPKLKNGQTNNQAVVANDCFISFLKAEFSANNLSKSVEMQKAVKARVTTKKTETKKVSVPTPTKPRLSELAFASKLSKTVEIFLDDEQKGEDIFRESFASDWNKEFGKKHADLLKEAEAIIAAKPRMKNEPTSYLVVFEDARVRWTAITLLLLNISVYSVLFCPNTTKLLIASIQNPIHRTVERVAKLFIINPHNNGFVTETAVVDNLIKKNVVDKKLFSNYIKNNNKNIKENQSVTEEDLNGQVAGVSE